MPNYSDNVIDPRFWLRKDYDKFRKCNKFWSQSSNEAKEVVLSDTVDFAKKTEMVKGKGSKKHVEIINEVVGSGKNADGIEKTKYTRLGIAACSEYGSFTVSPWGSSNTYF